MKSVAISAAIIAAASSLGPAAEFAAAFVPSFPRTSSSRSHGTAFAMAPSPPVMEILEDVVESKTQFDVAFTIPPNDLIDLAKDVLLNKGIGMKDDGQCLADEFEFVAAVVGPINRKEYLGALGSFKIEDGFDLKNKFYGFTVDPTQPNRVWFFQRLEAVHTGTFMGKEATGKEITYPPQVNHLDFNDKGEVIEYGFYTVDRRQGNTGGLGGAFGLMWAIGRPLPIPECQPYKKSLRFRLLGFTGKLMNKLRAKKNN